MTHRRIEFVVYPPDYTPGRDKFKVVRSWRQAKKIAKPGSEIDRHVQVHPGKRRCWERCFVSHTYMVPA